ALTKLDVLDKFEKIKVCTGYRYGNDIISDMPDEIDVLEKGVPVYQEFDGWQQSTEGIVAYSDLPENAKKYIEAIQEMSETRVAIISTGKRRDETIFSR
ncbi:MAG: adenylosuccinate synthetase, partial [Nitrospinota bacterium]